MFPPWTSVSIPVRPHPEAQTNPISSVETKGVRDITFRVLRRKLFLQW
jgi:hypothetical protein